MVVVVGSSYKLFVKPQERSRGRKYCGNKVTIVVRKTIKPEKRIVFVIYISVNFKKVALFNFVTSIRDSTSI